MYDVIAAHMHQIVKTIRKHQHLMHRQGDRAEGTRCVFTCRVFHKSYKRSFRVGLVQDFVDVVDISPLIFFATYLQLSYNSANPSYNRLTSPELIISRLLTFSSDDKQL